LRLISPRALDIGAAGPQMKISENKDSEVM